MATIKWMFLKHIENVIHNYQQQLELKNQRYKQKVKTTTKQNKWRRPSIGTNTFENYNKTNNNKHAQELD